MNKQPSNIRSKLASPIGQYGLITTNYWAFTLTDGALRMLVVLHFHQIGYGPLQIAFLFLFYEFFGVVTNLVGGWLGARWGLNNTMNIGLALQVFALAMLLVPQSMLTVIWVMAAQALSGIAKDLNKMSAKSAIKILVKDSQQNQLYKWVAILTGSKNTLKGIGFFLGGLLLAVYGFKNAILAMVVALSIVWVFSIFLLKSDLGKANNKPKFSQIFSKSALINRLSAARLFLFAARDVWFVVALPVYLSQQLGWSHWWVGSFFAIWIIIYGVIQAFSPKITSASKKVERGAKKEPPKLIIWNFALSIVPVLIALSLTFSQELAVSKELILIVGLIGFGVLFAVNSALHSYLIVSLADREAVSMDVGFYYMANAAGRLSGTVLSGLVYQQTGLVMCLWMSAVFLMVASILSIKIDQKMENIKN